MTGIALASLLTGTPIEAYIEALQGTTLIKPVVKFGVAFSLSYHLLGGVRHLVRTCSTVDFSRAGRSHWSSFRSYVSILFAGYWLSLLGIQVWDEVKMQEVEEVVKSSYALFGAAGFIGLVAMFTEFEG